jgi:hypothetical protein
MTIEERRKKIDELARIIRKDGYWSIYGLIESYVSDEQLEQELRDYNEEEE